MFQNNNCDLTVLCRVESNDTDIAVLRDRERTMSREKGFEIIIKTGKAAIWWKLKRHHFDESIVILTMARSVHIYVCICVCSRTLGVLLHCL